MGHEMGSKTVKIPWSTECGFFAECFLMFVSNLFRILALKTRLIFQTCTRDETRSRRRAERPLFAPRQ